LAPDGPARISLDRSGYKHDLRAIQGRDRETPKSVSGQMAAEVRGGRRIKTQTVLPNAETAPMLFWMLMAAGQVVMRKTGRRPYLNQLPPTP
jgi:hypothetical protein